MTEKPLINPVREKNEPLLPASGIIYINPGDIYRISAILENRNATSHFFFNSRLYTVADDHSGAFFVAGPAIGAPMAVMALEKLIALGARKVLVYGWCGSLCKDIEIGTLLLPTWGIPGEGTSSYYPGRENPASSETLRMDLETYFTANGISYSSGPVWSTDGVYRETTDKLAELSAKQIMGVDMEFTALARVAEFRNIDLAAAFLVSDNLWGEKWVAGFHQEAFRKMNKHISTKLLDAAQFLNQV